MRANGLLDWGVKNQASTIAGLLAAAMMLLSGAAEALTATANPTTCVNDTSTGTFAWANPGNAVSINTSYAIAATSASGTLLTNYLKCSGYGFTIPATATINGITVTIVRHLSSTNNTSAKDNAVRVVNSVGTIGTTDRGTATAYTTSDVTDVHGGATDLWGAAWTPADINSPNFGAAYSGSITKTSTSSRSISVDVVQISIDYTVPLSCTPPSNTPAGVTLSCVCDSFGRASLNPSTIFGGNWSTSHGASDSAGTNPYINATTGLLRLTENTGNNAKAATVPGIFPAAGNYISVEFLHYAYQGGNTGADGIAVTLSDYSVPAVPGGYGGSLGYAQFNTPQPGFAGGWVGVALDEYGNYQNPTEGRVGGSGFIPQSVGVRGPGSGANGYRWMGGTGGNPGGYSISANSTNSTPAPGYMYQVIVDARNYAGGTINVSVNRDATTKDGSSYTSLFGPFNAYTEANYALSQSWISKLVPDYWQISFTGSTGGSTNVHEIGALRICAQTVYPSTGGTASGFSAIDEAYTGAPTVPAYQNFQTGHIYTKLTGSSFKLWVAALTSTGISTGYSAVSNKYVQVRLVDNSDNACAPDPTTCGSANCTAKLAVESGATRIATFVSGSSAGVASPSPTFTLNSAYKNLIAVMKECTTSACTAFTATAPACSVDSFSVRPTSIASVTSIATPAGANNAATNAGTSGTPVFKAGTDSFALTAVTTGIAGFNSGYTGIMKIDNAALQAVSPATVAGAVTGTFPAATAGTPSSSATGILFTYSEVGGFKLLGYDPATDTTSLRGVLDGVDTANECTTPGLTTLQCDAIRAATWTGIDSVSTKSDCVLDSYANTRDANGKYGCNFGLLSTTAAIGRFIPDHFDTVVQYSTVLPCPAGLTCPASRDVAGNGLVYSGQPFVTQITAQNAGNATTRNYAGAFARATTLTAWDALGSTAPASSFCTTCLANGAVASSAFSAGVAITPAVSSASPLAYTFASVPTLPTDIYLRATENTGGDGVTSLFAVSSATREGAVKVVSGRVRVSNAYGSERLPLTLTAFVQYWTSAGYVTSATDNINTITAAKIARSGCAGGLVSMGVCNGLGAISSVAVIPSTPPTPPYGAYTIKLSAPGAGNTGSEYLTVNAGGWPAYLPSNSGRAVFGFQGGVNEFIYQREAY